MGRADFEPVENVTVGNRTAGMTAFVAGETARWQKVIRTANIRLG